MPHASPFLSAPRLLHSKSSEATARAPGKPPRAAAGSGALPRARVAPTAAAAAMAQPLVVKQDDDLDEEEYYSPFLGIEKSTTRVFHDPQLDARRCC